MDKHAKWAFGDSGWMPWAAFGVAGVVAVLSIVVAALGNAVAGMVIAIVFAGLVVVVALPVGLTMGSNGFKMASATSVFVFSVVVCFIGITGTVRLSTHLTFVNLMLRDGVATPADLEAEGPVAWRFEDADGATWELGPISRKLNQSCLIETEFVDGEVREKRNEQGLGDYECSGTCVAPILLRGADGGFIPPPSAACPDPLNRNASDPACAIQVQAWVGCTFEYEMDADSFQEFNAWAEAQLDCEELCGPERLKNGDDNFRNRFLTFGDLEVRGLTGFGFDNFKPDGLVDDTNTGKRGTLYCPDTNPEDFSSNAERDAVVLHVREVANDTSNGYTLREAKWGSDFSNTYFYDSFVWEPRPCNSSYPLILDVGITPWQWYDEASLEVWNIMLIVGLVLSLLSAIAYTAWNWVKRHR